MQFYISVQLFWPAFTNVEEFTKGIPIDIWDIKIEAEDGLIGKQQFLAHLDNFPDLFKQLRKYDVDVEHFKSVVRPYMAGGYMAGGYTVNKKYKTKKEQKMRRALGTLEYFFINIYYV
jgi:hypothetical protein